MTTAPLGEKLDWEYPFLLLAFVFLYQLLEFFLDGTRNPPMHDETKGLTGDTILLLILSDRCKAWYGLRCADLLHRQCTAIGTAIGTAKSRFIEI
jgi:hypothetical protein